jgi:hypothetical protein
MIRVVLDTNILVSALLQRQSLPARTFLTALDGDKARLCVTGDYLRARYAGKMHRSFAWCLPSLQENAGLRMTRDGGAFTSAPL